LTQAALAVLLGVSRRTVGDWEAGNKYPNVEHLKEFIALAVQRGAFATGREADEIRALWQAAHQRVLLDEAWLTAILRQPSPARSTLRRTTYAAIRESGGKLPIEELASSTGSIAAVPVAEERTPPNQSGSRPQATAHARLTHRMRLLSRRPARDWIGAAHLPPRTSTGEGGR
jgi:transcriptional regulator with XRE-family HTH domain